MNFIKQLFSKMPVSLQVFLYVMRLWWSGGGGDIKKQKIVASYVKRYHAPFFIETGTLLGDMVQAVRGSCRKTYSIEIDEFLVRVCYLRFLFDRNVTILHGDSGKVLRQLLPRINERAVFWLDGHYSGGRTAKGILETPIMEELHAIQDHYLNNHVILLDDVRCFGKGDYPSIDAVCGLIKSINPKYHIEVKDDILRACI